MNYKEKISENFTWEEFKVSKDHSDLAAKIEFTEKQKENLKNLVTFIIQPVRTFLNESVTVLSGVRSNELNIAVKGSKTSDHPYGNAGDITSNKIYTNLKKIAYDIWDLLEKNKVIKQLIYYPGRNFIHLSINTEGRPEKHELLRALKNGKYIKEK